MNCWTVLKEFSFQCGGHRGQSRRPSAPFINGHREYGELVACFYKRNFFSLFIYLFFSFSVDTWHADQTACTAKGKRAMFSASLVYHFHFGGGKLSEVWNKDWNKWCRKYGNLEQSFWSDLFHFFRNLLNFSLKEIKCLSIGSHFTHFDGIEPNIKC